MRSRILSLLVCLFFAVACLGCGDTLYKDGAKYETFGFFNRKTARDPAMCYEIIVGNVVWSILLAETFIFPIYFVGFSLFEANGASANPDRCY